MKSDMKECAVLAGLIGVGTFLPAVAIGFLLFAGAASDRPLSKSAGSAAEQSLLQSVDDLVVLLRTAPRNLVGSSMDGTAPATILFRGLWIALAVSLALTTMIALESRGRSKSRGPESETDTDDAVAQDRAPAAATESPSDMTIRIVRSTTPLTQYPSGMNGVVHPELERIGPAEYDLGMDVELWLHERQKTEFVTGREIYDHLKATGSLGHCLGLADGLAIQAKGPVVFRRLFQGEAPLLTTDVGKTAHSVYLWRSVFRPSKFLPLLSVPLLMEEKGKVAIYSLPLMGNWDARNPALRFRKAHAYDSPPQ